MIVSYLDKLITKLYSQKTKGEIKMNKTTKIVIGVVAAILVIVAVVAVVALSKPKTKLEPITSAEDLTALIDKVYEGTEGKLPMVMTEVIDTTDDAAVNMATGLENANDLEYIVESKAAIMSTPYSFVLAKAKDGVNVEEVAKKIHENVDERKWLCVGAEKVYTTTSGDVICLVMATEQNAKLVYENFKTLAGAVGAELERGEEPIELPEDMLPVEDGIDLPAVVE